MYNKEYFLINGKFIPLIAGSKGSKGCFATGTLIDTELGLRPIEEILPGQYVKSFNYSGKVTMKKVTHVFFHPKTEVAKVDLWNEKVLYVTDNHWFLTENNTFKELKHFSEEEALVGSNNERYIIKSIELNHSIKDTYNLTIEDNHTYIVDGVLVHNKGGGKGGGDRTSIEQDDTLFSTDLLFVLTAIGEGPIYRVNPNGPQDIEINEGPIDDLLNIEGDGLINPNLFYYAYTTGTLNQSPLKLFGDSIISPQSLSNPVTLKHGNRPGVSAASVTYMSTSIGTAWDMLTFKFAIPSLYQMADNGDILQSYVAFTITVYDSLGQTIIASVEHTINGKTGSSYKFDMDVLIPEDKISSAGYKFTVKKISPDPTNSKIQDNIVFFGWDEIQFGERAYPRTALIGYAISARSEYSGNIPTVTSIVKGLLCRVPSNYNQPMLFNGEIDWRNVEVDETNRQTYGYYQQKTGSDLVTDQFPLVYDGLWDGTFVYNWTQNPVWIVFELLTNRTWGLGIPIGNIDKYNFYKVAQYCDAVDQRTGRFTGVDATADGTYRYKPNTLYSAVREILLGLPNGTPIKERRFIFDAILASKKQIMDTLIQVTAIFRGILFYSAGKLTLNVDMPDELPMAVFNETNIIDGSISISGLKESDILTGVDVTFIDPINHYKREIIRISDDNILREVNNVENVKQIDISTGCTRRSQANRYGQYILASGKYLRRKIEFQSSVEAINLTIGDVISVSTRVSGTAWGHAGRILSNAVIANNEVYLEHFTSPGLTAPIFTANVNPIALRILQQNSDRIDYYILSNSNYTLQNTGNVTTGYDSARVQIVSRFNPTTRTWGPTTEVWQANTAPKRFDLWTLGEVEPANIFRAQTDKLFKVTQLQRSDEHDITISGIEYIPDIYVDSETQISYSPVEYRDLSSVLVPPPAPVLTLSARPVRNTDGSVVYALDINSSTDTSGYSVNIQTQFEIAYPNTLTDIIGIY